MWTNPGHVPNWVLGPSGWTMPVCEIDLRPGREWHFVWRRNGTGMKDGAAVSFDRLDKYLLSMA